MTNETRGVLGRSLIFIASVLLAFSLIGWILAEFSFKLAVGSVVLWLIGIITHRFEPSRLKPKQ